jgi:membrane-bound lytic murein transglycosylase D
MIRAMARLMAISLLFICVWPAWAQEPSEPSLAEAVRPKQGMTLCGEPVPVESPQIRERFEKAMLLTLDDRAQVLLWIKRAPRYMPFIEASLKAADLPKDLKYLAVAESALRPHAGSPKGAMGFWQLMPETARKYGLRVDAYMDERRNIFLSTPAALKYLRALRDQFPSWTLSLAAYNMGEEGLAAEMLEQNTQDYFNLYLPLETQLFIFRILAVKLILSDPMAFGFKVEAQDLYQAQSFDTVGVDCFQETPIRLVAEAAGTFFKTIKELNPHLRGHYLQPGHLQINLPQGSAKGFKERFAALSAKHHEIRQTHIYTVREGDSLSAIAERFEVPLAALLIWNRIGLNEPIHPGDRIVIYPGKAEKDNQ